MAGYIKIGDIKGKGPDTGPSDYYKYELKNLKSSPQLRMKLQQMGMSQSGISALTSGGTLSNKQDVEIVANILAQALK